MLTKRRDRKDGRRFVYRLTAKGMDVAPVLVELVLWSAKHERTDAPAEAIQEMQRRRKQFLKRLRAQWMQSAD